MKEAGCALIHTNFAWNLGQKIQRIHSGIKTIRVSYHVRTPLQRSNSHQKPPAEEGSLLKCQLLRCSFGVVIFNGEGVPARPMSYTQSTSQGLLHLLNQVELLEDTP